MVRINLAEFDVGILSTKMVKVREFNRKVELSKELVLYAVIFLGMSLGFAILCIVPQLLKR